jgi:hypothetical protein
MSMPIVQHVWQKSQTRGSARTLLLTLAIHANDCCGVAWVSDATLHHEVNVSRQRIHELKNAVEASGELVILERPGTTNLYFVAMHGVPLGPQGEYQTTRRGQHMPGCPLRHADLRQQCARLLAGEIEDDAPAGVSDPPDTSSPAFGEGVSELPDPQVSGPPDGGCQESLTQKTMENRRRKQGRRWRPVFLSRPTHSTKTGHFGVTRTALATASACRITGPTVYGSPLPDQETPS